MSMQSVVNNLEFILPGQSHCYMYSNQLRYAHAQFGLCFGMCTVTYNRHQLKGGYIYIQYLPVYTYTYTGLINELDNPVCIAQLTSSGM